MRFLEDAFSRKHQANVTLPLHRDPEAAKAKNDDVPNEIETDKEKLTDDKDEDDKEDLLPPIVTEGKHFRNELPDRLYLDSDPEFHLNLHIVLSYLMLFHIDSHFLMVNTVVTAQLESGFLPADSCKECIFLELFRIISI